MSNMPGDAPAPTGIADYLAENGSITYSNSGTSMMPLLKEGRDLFTVRAKRPGERFAVGDVVLYRRPPDKYVLHRIVEVGDGSYTILGDNCVVRETGIPESEVLGVMTGYVRRGVAHSVTDPVYVRYTAGILKNEKKRVKLLKLRARIRSAGAKVLRTLTGTKRK